MGESELFQVELIAEARHDLKKLDRLATAVQPTPFGSVLEYGFDLRHDQQRVAWRCDMPRLETLARIQQLKRELLKHYYRADRELERLQKWTLRNETNCHNPTE